MSRPLCGATPHDQFRVHRVLPPSPASKSSDLGPPPLGRLGRPVQDPALGCRRPLRRKGPEGDLWPARGGGGRGGGGRGRRRGDQGEGRGPAGAVGGGLGRPGGRQGRGRRQGGHPVNRGQGRGRREQRRRQRRRRRPLLARRHGSQAEGGGRRVGPQQGQVSSAGGERRRGSGSGSLGRGGELGEGRPRPRREGKGGGRRRLQQDGVQLAGAVGKMGDEASSYGVYRLPVQGAEVPDHLAHALPEAQRPVVDCQRPGVKETWRRKKSLVTETETR